MNITKVLNLITKKVILNSDDYKMHLKAIEINNSIWKKLE